MKRLQLGIRHNLHQVVQQLLQVLLVGMTVGMMRNVVPALAEQEFGVPRGSFLLLVTFVVAFGVVKGGMNFVAGRRAEEHGRKKVLLLGWLVALPIPILIYFSTSWNAIVLATLLLGINQGLTWSMTQTSALDFTQPQQRGWALSQAGLVEKFVDALVWMIWPLYLVQHGLPLTDIGWVLGSYGITWGVAQLATGYFSDVIGRHRLNWMGMWLCGLGVALFPFGSNAFEWSSSAALSGLGMAMLYPNLSAAVADLAEPAWRASAIGIYRFWRDIGYAVGAAGIGLVAFLSGNLDCTFYFVAISMLLSGAWLAWRGQDA